MYSNTLSPKDFCILHWFYDESNVWVRKYIQNRSSLQICPSFYFLLSALMSPLPAYTALSSTRNMWMARALFGLSCVQCTLLYTDLSCVYSLVFHVFWWSCLGLYQGPLYWLILGISLLNFWSFACPNQHCKLRPPELLAFPVCVCVISH